LYRGCVGGVRGCLRCILCQKRLRLSRKVDECRPLLVGLAARQRNHDVPLVGVLAGAYTRPLLSST